MIDALTDHFKLPDGKMRLNQMQAAFLLELHDEGAGACVWANVGTGKTLCSFLAPVALESERPLLLNYASLLRDKTPREFSDLKSHWRSAKWAFKSYETLSRKQSKDYLFDLAPDLVVCDEAYALQNPRSGLTRRLFEYRKRNRECRFVFLTGTPGDESIEQVAHIADCALGPKSPYPREHFERRQWALALDVKLENDLQRVGPGALKRWVEPPSEDLDLVRAGVGRRIAETPGIIVNRKPGAVSASLYLKGWFFDDYSPQTEVAFKTARELWTTPDGRELDEAAETAQLFRSLALGYYKVVDPTPPPEWKEARRAWNAFVRDDLRSNRSRRMTADQTADACRIGALDSGGVWETWCEIQTTFRRRTQTEWFDRSVLEAVAGWLEREKAIVWTPSPDFGRELKALTGVPFFHRHGCDDSAGSIETHAGGPAILSVRANTMGRNLQDRWHKMLVLGPTASGTQHEQMIGRLHRFGQKASAVEVTYFFGCVENFSALQEARERQRSDEKLNSNEAAKLVNCDWLIPECVVNRSARWYS